MTVHTRRGIATHGFRGLTGRLDRRLAVATQGLRGYSDAVIAAARNYIARITGVFYVGRIIKRFP